MIRGGNPATLDELAHFHDRLFCEYEALMGADNAAARMKEWWSYAKCCFADPASVHLAVRGVRGQAEYMAAVERVFGTEALADEPRLR